VHEDYKTIIADALTYYVKCETVEIGKRFSQFLLHGVPTHLSLPEISDSIATNYPQLVQGQTPQWLTPASRRENKMNSTIVMTHWECQKGKHWLPEPHRLQSPMPAGGLYRIRSEYPMSQLPGLWTPCCSIPKHLLL